MEDKIGVFICTSYGIADALDLDGLTKVATEECGAQFCTTLPTCEGSGLEAIRQAIENESLTKALIAGISMASLMVSAKRSVANGLTIRASVNSLDAPVKGLSIKIPSSSNRLATNSLATRFIPSCSEFTMQKCAIRLKAISVN